MARLSRSLQEQNKLLTKQMTEQKQTHDRIQEQLQVGAGAGWLQRRRWGCAQHSMHKAGGGSARAALLATALRPLRPCMLLQVIQGNIESQNDKSAGILDHNRRLTEENAQLSIKLKVRAATRTQRAVACARMRAFTCASPLNQRHACAQEVLGLLDRSQQQLQDVAEYKQKLLAEQVRRGRSRLLLRTVAAARARGLRASGCRGVSVLGACPCKETTCLAAALSLRHMLPPLVWSRRRSSRAPRRTSAALRSSTRC